MFRYLVTWYRTTPVYRALRREDAQDLAEYALILGLIAVALIVILQGLTGGITAIFNKITQTLTDAVD